MRFGRGKRGSGRALQELRAARRRRFVERLDVMELVYRVYVGVIFGAIALGVLAGAIHDAPLTPHVVDDIAANGPALLGLGIALAVLAGLRSGSRGGPVAIEEAEVQYVLLAPVDRGAALRPAAIRQMRIAALVGAVLGGVVGNFLFRRVPGSGVEWIACLACFGALLPVCTLGSALIASGRRLAPALAGTIGTLLLAWTLADVLLGVKSSPATMLGVLATVPLQSGATAWLAAGGVLLALAAGLLGLALIGGLSLEAARRRAQLTAVLRFSASIQDVRSVVVLRRQLASESPRRRPWLRLRDPRLSSAPILRRDWQSLLHWPAARIARTLVLGLAAGLLCAGAWAGSTPLLVLPGAVLMIAAIDLVEPIAEEFDHPMRRDLLPLEPDFLITRHLWAPCAAMALVAVCGAAAALALGASATTVGLAAVMVVPTSLVLPCCAAFTLTTDPYANLLSPSVASLLSAVPLVVAVFALGLPVILARVAARAGTSVLGSAISAEVVVLIVAGVMVLFLGSRARKSREVPA